MKFLEKDLEKIIFESPNEILVDKGLNIYGKKLRQKIIGNYGISDIISYYKDYDYTIDYKYNSKNDSFDIIQKLSPELIIDVFELKKEKIGISSFLQCCKYSKGIIDYLKHRNITNFKVNLILVGKTIDKSGSFCFIPDIFDNVRFYTYDYDIDGILFKKQENYSLINKGFKS